ncbi:DUF2513 domain-containing protein [Methylotuvimicrobium alcaliphilum]|uniref:DUF2513 domain-containing protein n=1 Tax=Methylotuvimicrobium alcaliphilum (strain DSM 19304 / NCIMB 14124 / VKM B-2133 / 20Z) TaxID=1091494 RepID=G4T4M6_META2|nr:DUF2513 domain-containing protein [Methylotuvimicrobium alcaliphilum]CCE25782.1 conserved protein of unknown function [Methylotuvimicrobium alcaliphilum 20Z]
MKRDWELVRKILLKIEALETIKRSVVCAQDIEDYDEENVSYHIYLLEQAGLIEAAVQKHHNTGIRALAYNLTWSGHEFLDVIRDPDIWQQTKEGAKKATGFSLELLRDLAKGLIKKKIEEHTGIQL